MAITIHYVNKDWELVSRLLEIAPIDDRKEATYLLGILNESLATWGIEDKILSLVFYFLISFLIN